MSNKKPRMELSERFKALKKYWGFSQKEMAERLDIGLSTYQYYERGEREIPAKLLITITTYGVSPEWILTGDGDMFEKQGTIDKDESIQSDQAVEKCNGFINQENANRLIDKLIRLEYISESQLDRVEKEIDRLLEIAEDVVSDIKKAEDANWQKDKEQKKEAVMAAMGKTQRRKKAAG